MFLHSLASASLALFNISHFLQTKFILGIGEKLTLIYQ